MAEKKQRGEINEWVRVWLISLYLVVLFYLYAYYEGSGKTAQQIPLEAHFQHGMVTIIIAYASFIWGVETTNLANRFLFISFALFRVLAFVHRIVAYIFDMVLVTDAPTYSVLALIALIFGVYDFIRRRNIKGNRASEC